MTGGLKSKVDNIWNAFAGLSSSRITPSTDHPVPAGTLSGVDLVDTRDL